MTAVGWVTTELLVEANQITAFSCDRESVNEWLRDKAIAASRNVHTKLYLDEAESVVAFAATTMVLVNVTNGTSAQRQGNRDGESVGYLLAQMGVRTGLTGNGLGKAVLADVMASAARAHSEAPFPLFIVDAADEALIGYYEQFGLRRLTNQLRLATPMRQIIKSLSQ